VIGQAQLRSDRHVRSHHCPPRHEHARYPHHQSAMMPPPLSATHSPSRPPCRLYDNSPSANNRKSKRKDIRSAFTRFVAYLKQLHVLSKVTSYSPESRVTHIMFHQSAGRTFDIGKDIVGGSDGGQVFVVSVDEGVDVGLQIPLLFYAPRLAVACASPQPTRHSTCCLGNLCSCLLRTILYAKRTKHSEPAKRLHNETDLSPS
jgi:hypothetical protein